jgi:hypothetical protein
MKQPLLITNLRDDKHCTISSIISIYEYFTGLMLSYKEGEVIQNYVEDKGLWILPSLVWFVKQGFEVVHYTSFDYQAYFELGDKYLEASYNKETVEEIIEYSNLKEIKHLIPEYLKIVKRVNVNPNLEDLDVLLGDGYLVEVNVVWNKLYPCEEDMFYHSVLVYNKTKEGDYLIMDPGLPAQYYTATSVIMADCMLMELNKDGSYSSEMVGFRVRK